METAEIEAIQQHETSTLSGVTPHILSLNVGLSARIAPVDWLSFGFNLDLIGQSFGPEQVAVYEEEGFSSSPSLHPTQTNLFLVACASAGH